MEIPFKDFVPVLATIVGGSLALTGSSLQQFLSRNAERKKLVREKLEELYMLANEIDLWTGQECQTMTAMQSGMEQNKPAAADPPIVRLVMLTKIYAPNSLPLASELKEKTEAMRHSAFSFYMDIAQANQRLPIDKFESYLRPWDDVKTAAESFRDEIVNYARKFILKKLESSP